MERTISFVDENALLPIREKVVLFNMMSQCEKDEELYLSNLDLSEMDDCCSICFDGYKLENIVFSKFSPENPRKRHLFNLSFVGAELNKVSFVQAHLQQCNFDTMDVEAHELHYKKMHGEDMPEDMIERKVSILNEVDFFFSELDYCRFRRANAKFIDFRYSHVRDCTMSEFDVTYGDFYFCNFEGCTNFIDSRFTDCSLTCASFENDCLRMNNIIDGIAQEKSQIYHDGLIRNPQWMKYNPCNSFSSMNHKANEGRNAESDAKIAGEAMYVYKQLSGLYAGKGLNRDSNRAYRKSKLCEIEYCKLQMKIAWGKSDFKDFFAYLWSFIKAWGTKLLGFGYQWKATVIWFIIIVLGYGIYGMFRKGTDDDYNIIFHSLYNSMGPHDCFTEMVPLPWASFESMLGILLIGFLGFIIANNIRNDS
jgi:uncharacterized protein YjbI with pentapeptide repeats